MSEGTLGPDLTEAGKKFKIDYLWESIVEPRANLDSSFMPNFHLGDADVKALVIFLKSRRGVNFGETTLDRYKAHVANVAVLIPPGTGGEKAGEQLIADRACTACHKLGDRDGGIAPDLSYEGLEHDGVWLMDHFRNPRSRVPDSIMPTFRFPGDDFERITAYLTTLKTPPPPMAPADTYKAICQRCHGEKGDGQGKVAWYLDPSPRDLTKAAFMTSKSRERFVNSIQEGIPGTSMPSWKNVLKPEQINGVLSYVMTTFTKEPFRESKPHNVPDHNPVTTSAASIHHGEEVFLERCTGCHGRKADGKGPNSLDISPKPRNLRNSAFVASVDDRRIFDSVLYGVQGTAMPSWTDYGLTTNDVGDIVNFIRSINQQKGSQQNAGQ
jgi:cytochrome c oxidase cbb3-type subunit 2